MVRNMALGFPLYIDLNGNNCVVFGGGDYAASCVKTLLAFGARVTVICPILSEKMRELDAASEAVRHIPRRYYRGDCTNAYLCVAATNDESVNIAISDECKAKGVPVNMSRPAAFGNFIVPAVIVRDDMVISIAGNQPPDALEPLRTALENTLPTLLETAGWGPEIDS